jgi:hypothetical protein
MERFAVTCYCRAIFWCDFVWYIRRSLLVHWLLLRLETDPLASALKVVRLLPLRTRCLSVHDSYATFLVEVNNGENPKCTRKSIDNEILRPKIGIIELERTGLARMALAQELFLGTIGEAWSSVEEREIRRSTPTSSRCFRAQIRYSARTSFTLEEQSER